MHHSQYRTAAEKHKYLFIVSVLYAASRWTGLPFTTCWAGVMHQLAQAGKKIHNSENI